MHIIKAFVPIRLRSQKLAPLRANGFYIFYCLELLRIISIMSDFAVYILCNKRNGTLYVGFTNNLQRRILEHKNAVVESFTKQYGLTQLVYVESYKYVNDQVPSLSNRPVEWFQPLLQTFFVLRQLVDETVRLVIFLDFQTSWPFSLFWSQVWQNFALPRSVILIEEIKQTWIPGPCPGWQGHDVV